jgi:nitronate monooxygenase
MLTRVFTGRHARGVVNRFVREMLAHESNLPAYPWQSRIVGPIAQAAARQEIHDFIPLWAGQNVPLVRRRSASELMAFLVDDIDRVAAQLGRWTRTDASHAVHSSTSTQEHILS